MEASKAAARPPDPSKAPRGENPHLSAFLSCIMLQAWFALRSPHRLTVMPGLRCLPCPALSVNICASLPSAFEVHVCQCHAVGKRQCLLKLQLFCMHANLALRCSTLEVWCRHCSLPVALPCLLVMAKLYCVTGLRWGSKIGSCSGCRVADGELLLLQPLELQGSSGNKQQQPHTCIGSSFSWPLPPLLASSGQATHPAVLLHVHIKAPIFASVDPCNNAPCALSSAFQQVVSRCQAVLCIPRCTQ